MGFFSDLIPDAGGGPAPKIQTIQAAVLPESVTVTGPEGGIRLSAPADMSDEDAMRLSARLIMDGTERLTRRNMKDCVSDHLQDLCRQDPAFARRVLRSGKTMAHCFRYINQKAREFAEQEMKDQGESPVNGVCGLDIPDSLCYEWAEAYFNDPDAPEDRPAPKPAAGITKTEVKAPPKKAPKPKDAVEGQISLMGEV